MNVSEKCNQAVRWWTPSVRMEQQEKGFKKRERKSQSKNPRGVRIGERAHGVESCTVGKLKKCVGQTSKADLSNEGDENVER